MSSSSSGRRATLVVSYQSVLSYSGCLGINQIVSSTPFHYKEKSLSKIHQDNQSTIALVDRKLLVCLPVTRNTLPIICNVHSTYNIQC